MGAGEFDLDRALAQLAAEEAARRPRPSEALTARVLADAAGAAGASRPQAAARPRVKARRTLFGIDRSFLGLAGGIGATLAACLVLGFFLGYGVDGQEFVPTLEADLGEEFMLSDAGGAIFGVDAPY